MIIYNNPKMRSSIPDINIPSLQDYVNIIGVIGSRTRDTQEDFELVLTAFDEVYKPGDVICSGLCSKGGDRFAVVLSKIYNMPFIWYPPEYSKYGKKAGMVRNEHIAKASTTLIATPDSDPAKSVGTRNTMRWYTELGGTDLILL